MDAMILKLSIAVGLVLAGHHWGELLPPFVRSTLAAFSFVVIVADLVRRMIDTRALS